MIRSSEPRGIVLKPRAAARNQIDAPDAVAGITVKAAGKASDQRPFKHFSGTEAHPRTEVDGFGGFRMGSGAAATDSYFFRPSGGGFQIQVPAAAPVKVFTAAESQPRIEIVGNAVRLSDGTAAFDTTLERWGAKAFRTVDTQIRIQSPPGDQAGGVDGNGNVPLWIDCRTSDGAILDGNDATGTIRALMVRGRPIEGTNGSRTDTPLTDAANVTDHTSFSFFEARSLESSPENRYDSKGSLHHFYSDVTLIPHSGGGALTTPFGVAASDTLTRTAHGLAAGDPIQFTALTGGAGLAVQTPYFVIAAGLTANAFQISATLGGGAINFTTDVTAGTFERIPYCEIVNFYGAITAQRKGAFVSNMELRTIVAANSPARVAVARFIVEDANAISAYNATNFGAGSRFIDSGSMGLEVLSQGAQRAGTGISIMGSSGWERALRVYNASQVLVSGIDGNGGVFTRTKAGTYSDADFRQPADGLLGLNTSVNDLEYRSGGAWRGLQDQSYIKKPVRVASVANLTISAPGATVDGVSMVSGDRMLLKDQTTEAENGIYVWNGAASAATRARDSDEGIELRGGVQVMVEEGTKNKDTAWLLVTNGIPTIGTSTLRFSRTQPAYARGADLDPWAALSAISETFQREHCDVALTLATAATTYLCGGCVIPANRTVTNVNVFMVAAGATWTIRHFSIVRQADRAVLQRTANATSTPSANAALATALQSPYTAPVDTPVWIAVSSASGTAGSVAACPTVIHANLMAVAPVLSGTSTAPTSTPFAVDAVLNAPTAITQNIYAYLT